MEVDKETETRIKELQIIEQNLQSILMQKQTFQMDMSEVDNAFSELSKTNEDVFKIVGNIMVRSSKENLIKDLKQKKDLVELRIKTLDSQEKDLSKTSEELRKKVLAKIKK